MWYPLRTDYDNLYSTAAPWIAPLLVGLQAAVYEEFLFRLFAISFLYLLIRRWWVALLVPAAIWGFSHPTYLTAPVYLRGVELTLVGLVYGYFLVRYDVLTTIVAHYTYNAVVVGLPLLRSHEPYFFYSGLVVAAMPALPLLPGLYVAAKRWFSGAAREPSALTIRPATVDDLPRLAAEREKERRSAGTGGLWERLPHALESSEYQVLCADWRGQPVGCIVGRIEAGENSVGRIEAGENSVGHIEILWVARAYRRRGCGSALHARLAEWLYQQGATRLRVEAPAFNTAAKAFWLAQGFSPDREVLTALLQDYSTAIVAQ
jgi:ribosomal protein S18 acetylase RimI-like enzyme